MSMEPVFARLRELEIPYIRHDHAAVYTVAESMQAHHSFGDGHSKNLFLKGKDGAFYLVVMQAMKRLDMKNLSAALATRLSFASPEELKKYLGLTPGSVSPFGLLNDSGKAVQVVVDADLAAAARVYFHPNINTATLEIAQADFRKFLDRQGNPWRIQEL